MRRLCATALVSVLLALGIALASPAIAHEGDGRLTNVSSDEAGPGSFRYVVELTFEDDQHPANDAAVTVVATQSGSTERGDKIGPVQMVNAGDGRYQTTVEFPKAGDWTVRFSADDPSATLEQMQTVSEAASSSKAAASRSTSEESSGVRQFVITSVAIAVGVVLLAGVAFVALSRRRSAEGDAPEEVDDAL